MAGIVVSHAHAGSKGKRDDIVLGVGYSSSKYEAQMRISGGIVAATRTELRMAPSNLPGRDLFIPKKRLVTTLVHAGDPWGSTGVWEGSNRRRVELTREQAGDQGFPAHSPLLSAIHLGGGTALRHRICGGPLQRYSPQPDRPFLFQSCGPGKGDSLGSAETRCFRMTPWMRIVHHGRTEV